MSDYQVTHEKARCFYPRYERKSESQHQTHYCPGCGHGIAHKLIARAIDDLGIQNRTVLVSPVGCSVFAYYYFDVGNIQAAHGRAPAVAIAVKRSRPEAIVLSYQGDGDLAAIGSAEILHAANRGEPITVFFLNNAIYGMTGGQMAPTTLIGQKSTTSPLGRSVWNEGYPLHVCEVLAALDAPVYLERVALGNNKMIQTAAKAVRRALEAQVKGLGFSLVEILSPCPTIWKQQPVEAQRWVREEMTKVFPLGVFRDRLNEAEPRPSPPPAPALEEVPRVLNIAAEPRPESVPRPSGSGLAWPADTSGAGESNEGGPLPDGRGTDGRGTDGRGRPVDFRIKIAGFGGQGVLMLGEVLAEAGLDAGLEVSWLPSYGPEMRSGTSNCHVRISTKEIDSPLVAHPNILLALNEPSLRKFVVSVEPGGWILYNGRTIPDDCVRSGVHLFAEPFVEYADALGDARAANIVMLGALLEATGLLPEPKIDSALRRKVKSERWLELDRRALARGRRAVREGVCHAS